MSDLTVEWGDSDTPGELLPETIRVNYDTNWSQAYAPISSVVAPVRWAPSQANETVLLEASLNPEQLFHPPPPNLTSKTYYVLSPDGLFVYHTYANKGTYYPLYRIEAYANNYTFGPMKLTDCPEEQSGAAPRGSVCKTGVRISDDNTCQQISSALPWSYLCDGYYFWTVIAILTVVSIVCETPLPATPGRKTLEPNSMELDQAVS